MTFAHSTEVYKAVRDLKELARVKLREQTKAREERIEEKLSEGQVSVDEYFIRFFHPSGLYSWIAQRSKPREYSWPM